MQTTFKVCKLYMLLCLGLSTNASPILTGLKTTSSDYQQSDSSHHEFFTQFPPNSNFGKMDTKFNLQSGTAVDQSLKSTPGITTTYRDQNGNLVTQVKKETYNKENGQSAHTFEIEESKQLPNGYSKSFKKEYSSSSVVGSQPTTFFQKPLNTDKYYNSEQISNGQSFQNYQGQSIPTNIGNIGVQSNFKSTVDQSLTNVPGVTSTFRDQNGNIVTQVKKEIVTNNDGQNGHVVEYEETKQLPNGYSKSFKKEYSSSSVVGSQPTTFFQKPLNTDKYYNSEQISNGQSFQNYQGQSIPANIGNIGVQSNFKSTVDQSLTNIPGVTSTFRDQNGNIVTQVKKEIVTNNDGQNGHVVEYEETKQLPNGYSKSFKKEYSSSSVVGSQPTTFFQKPLNAEKYYNSEQISNGQSFQNYQGQSKSANIGNIGVQSNFKSTVDQSLTNVPGVTSTFRDQNGNIVTQVKKEIVTNNDGQNGHVVEYEETKQLPNGYSKSFKKEFSSSSVISARPTLIKDTTTEKNTYLPQKFTQGDTEKFNGYNTFFNNQKYTLEPNSPINSQAFNNKKQTESGQQSVDLPGYSTSSQMGQQSVDISNQYPTKKPSSQKFEKIESFSTQTQEEVGQQSVDLPGYSTSSQIGQQSVDISNQYPTKKPSSQKFEKIESFSTQTQEEVGQQSVDISKLYSQNKPIGQQSVDLSGYSTSSQMGQQPVDINNQYTTKKPSGQKFEKMKSVSTQTQEEVGQQSVDLPGYSTSSQMGQQSVDISNQYPTKKPSSQKFEKIESFSTQTQEEVGQQSVDISKLYSQNKPIGQQSVDLSGYSTSSQMGQQSVDISNQYPTKKPSSQKFEKIESFSTQTQEEVGQQSVDISKLYSQNKPIGQQSVDLSGYSTSSQMGQQSVDISNQYPIKKPSSQKFEKKESFSTQTQEEVGQQSVDLPGYSTPSQMGQQSVDISKLYSQNKPYGQQFEKIESSYQNKHNFIGQQPVNINVNDKSSQQYGTGQQIFSQPIAGEQIQGSEFFKSNYGGTSQLLDLGVLGQQPTGYTRAPGQQNLNNNKYIGQQSIGVFESQSTIEKNINLSSADQLQTDVDGYQGNMHHNYQTYHGDQSMKNPAFQGQQTVDYTSDLDGHIPVYQKQYGNTDFQSSKLSSQTGQFSTGNNEPINSKYNSVFDKLGQLEHEILGAKSTVNINKGNVQTAYSTNHNVKSMPVQTSQQESHFSKTINENTQYIEPESEIAYSKSLKKDSKLVVQQDTIENHQTSNNDNFSENPTTPSSVWKKIGDKFKGSIENAKNKAQQLATNINDKVGFSSITGNPC